MGQATPRMSSHCRCLRSLPRCPPKSTHLRPPPRLPMQHGRTPLHEAAVEGHAPVVALLLATPGVDPLAMNRVRAAGALRRPKGPACLNHVLLSAVCRLARLLWTTRKAGEKPSTLAITLMLPRYSGQTRAWQRRSQQPAGRDQRPELESTRNRARYRMRTRPQRRRDSACVRPRSAARVRRPRGASRTPA